MNFMLWICQLSLGLLFTLSGTRKSVQSKARMIETGQTGVRAHSLPFIRFIAAAELLGAIGLIVPWSIGILSVLTPLASIGLAVIMVGAARAHARQHEPRNVAANAVVLSLCLFVAVGRFGMLCKIL